MIYFKQFIGLLCAAAFALPLTGCGDSNKTPETEKELKLVLSDQKVQTGEEVSFTVTSGDEDVTSAARIRNLKTDAYLDGRTFVPEETGIYQFEAELNGRVSKPVSLKVIGSFEPKGEFYRQVLVQKFTATWCVYCPNMTTSLEKLDKEIPGRMVLMSIHAGDDFSITEGEKLANDFKISSIPRAVFDYRVIATDYATELRNALTDEIEEYPAVCGIAAEARVEGNQLFAEAKVRFSEKGRYRVCCAVIEDKLLFEDGYAKDGTYNHVLRKFATSRTGEALGECEAGTEYPFAYTITVDKTWNLQNCSVLFYVMKEDGASVYTNNIVSCPAVKGSCDFRYETK